MHIRMFLICLHHSLLVLTSETLQNDPSLTANNGHMSTQKHSMLQIANWQRISSCRFHAGGFRNRDCCKLHLMSEINVANLHRKNENTEITFFHFNVVRCFASKYTKHVLLRDKMSSAIVRHFNRGFIIFKCRTNDRAPYALSYGQPLAKNCISFSETVAKRE